MIGLYQYWDYVSTGVLFGIMPAQSFGVSRNVMREAAKILEVILERDIGRARLWAIERDNEIHKMIQKYPRELNKKYKIHISVDDYKRKSAGRLPCMWSFLYASQGRAIRLSLVLG